MVLYLLFFIFCIGMGILVNLPILIPNKKYRKIVLIILVIPFIILIVILFVSSAIKDYKKNTADCQYDFNQIKDVFFQGKVISSFTDWQSTILCISIDTSNTTSFYTSGYYPLKIENGIAVLPIGIVDKNISEEVFMANAEYVIVNKNNNLLVNYIIKDDTLTEPLKWAFRLGYLREKHMSVFDDIINQNKPKTLE